MTVDFTCKVCNKTIQLPKSWAVRYKNGICSRECKAVSTEHLSKTRTCVSCGKVFGRRIAKWCSDVCKTAYYNEKYHSPEKICPKCNESHPRTNQYFAISKIPSHLDGLDTWCKNCRSAFSEEFYYTNHDEILTARKADYRINPDKYKKYTDTYRMRHPVTEEQRIASRAKFKENYAANPERYKQYTRDAYAKRKAGLVEMRTQRELTKKV